MKRLPLIASFLLFLLLCASLAYWGLELFKRAPRQVAAPPRTMTVEVSPEAGGILFGGGGPTEVVATNYQLHGVILSGTSDDSVAILSMAGNPPQAVPVNREVSPGVTVQEVHRDHVLLLDGGATRKVLLPEREVAQLGSAGMVAPVDRSHPGIRPVTPRPTPATNVPAPNPAVIRAPTTSGPVISPRANAVQQPAQTYGGTPQGQQDPQTMQSSQGMPYQQAPQNPNAQPYYPGQQQVPQNYQQPQTPYNPNQPPTSDTSGASGVASQGASGTSSTGVPTQQLPGGPIGVPSLPATPGVPGQPGPISNAPAPANTAQQYQSGQMVTGR